MSAESMHLRQSLGGVLFLAMAACGDDTVVLVPDGGLDATTLDASVDASDGASDGACTGFDASGLDEAAVQAGADLVVALKCRKCHGDALSGNPDGVKSPQTEGGLAYPPNLTPDPATGLGCWTDDQIVNAFLHGIDNQGQPLCPPMPQFADAGVDASGAADILAYLRSLPARSMNVPNTPSCTLGPIDDGGADATGGEAGTEGGSDAGSDGSDAGPDAGDAGADAADASDGSSASDAADSGDAASE